jgi:CheY-like chemotaxis protein
VTNRILIVDDDDDQRRLLRAQLAELGAEIVEAADAASALDSIRVLRPRLVLLDWCMPDNSGVAVARSVSEDPELSDVLVIMLTGLADPRDAELAAEAGAAAFLTKPVSGDMLRMVVRGAMSGSERLTREAAGSGEAAPPTDHG